MKPTIKIHSGDPIHTLYDYQQRGSLFLATRRRAYLADEMGLGKTVQAIVAITQRQLQSVLVISPASVVANWWREFEKWGSGQMVDVLSYASLHKVRPIQQYDVVILDEAHYTKSPKAKRTKSALALAREAPSAYLLSGTPMPNHPGELFTMFWYLWPEKLPSKINTHWKWLNYFCKVRQTRFGPKVYGFQRANELKELLNGVLLRRKLNEVALDLPPLRVTSQVLPVAAKSFEEMLAQEEGAEDILRALQEEDRSNDPSTSRIRRLIGEWKAPHIAAQLADELADGQHEKLVVMYHHRSVGGILEKALWDHGLVRYDGRTPPQVRQRFIDRFNTDPEVKVFLGQQVASGEGINLQAASEIVLVEPAWTPDANRQAIKRIHRIGQDNPCRARVFAVAKTIDESVMEAIAHKTTMQEAVGLR
jgi:SWI/SNF-related matrix-associated actin-dependent regulator 1 of chromatin subfamily A